MKGEWRTLRVVVEIPVRGEYTERDLTWDVERKLGAFCPRDYGAIFGRLRVKSWSMVAGKMESKTENRLTREILLDLHKYTKGLAK